MRLVQKHQQSNGKGQGKIQYSQKPQPFQNKYKVESTTDNTMEGFPLVLDYNLVKDIKNNYEKAKRFVSKYTNGDQYKNNFLSNIFFEDGTPSMDIERGNKPFPTLRYADDGSYYNINNNIIGFDPNQKVEGFEDPVMVMVHELGHYLDKNYKLKNSEEYPNIGLSSSVINRLSLDKSKSFQDFKNLLQELDKDPALFLKYPEVYYELAHDGVPSESYADLLAIRYLLDKEKIYDSTSNLDWDYDTYLKTKDYIKQHPNNRLFQNFDAGDVYYMLNHIAENQQNKQNKPNRFGKIKPNLT